MTKKKKTKSLNLAVIFFVIFGFLVLLSIILKIVNVYQKSTFDGENHFTVKVLGEDENASLVSFAPKSNAIYILNIKNGKNKNLMEKLNVPIDGEIISDIDINEGNIKLCFFKFLVPFKVKETNLTIFDFLRFSLYANSVPANSIYQKDVSVNDDQVVLKSLGVYSYFIDQSIAGEKITIEIINGTDKFGLGNKLASFLSNIGANIIMVSTGDSIVKKSKIEYFEKESYTLNKLSRILDFPIKKIDKKKLGEITIVIGEDALGKNRF